MQLESGLTKVSSDLKSSTIVFLVGDQLQSYEIHADLLKCSKHFTDVLYPNGELLIRDIEIENMGTAQFDMFMLWLYYDTIPSITTTTGTLTHEDLVRFLNLYLNAIRWTIPALQNAILDTIRTYFANDPDITCFPDHSIKRIYQKLDAASPLQRFAVDFSAYSIEEWSAEDRKTFIENRMENGSFQFGMEIYEALLLIAKGDGPEDPTGDVEGLYHLPVPATANGRSEPSEEACSPGVGQLVQCGTPRLVTRPSSEEPSSPGVGQLVAVGTPRIVNKPSSEEPSSPGGRQLFLVGTPRILNKPSSEDSVSISDEQSPPTLSQADDNEEQTEEARKTLKVTMTVSPSELRKLVLRRLASSSQKKWRGGTRRASRQDINYLESPISSPEKPIGGKKVRVKEEYDSSEEDEDNVADKDGDGDEDSDGNEDGGEDVDE